MTENKNWQTKFETLNYVAKILYFLNEFWPPKHPVSIPLMIISNAFKIAIIPAWFLEFISYSSKYLTRLTFFHTPHNFSTTFTSSHNLQSTWKSFARISRYFPFIASISCELKLRLKGFCFSAQASEGGKKTYKHI